MRIYGTPPAGVNFGIDEGSLSVLGTNTGGDHTAITAFRTSTGQIPSWDRNAFPLRPSFYTTFYIGENYRLPLSNYAQWNTYTCYYAGKWNNTARAFISC